MGLPVMTDEQPHYGKAVLLGVAIGFILFCAYLIITGVSTTPRVIEQMVVLGGLIVVGISSSSIALLVQYALRKRTRERYREHRKAFVAGADKSSAQT